MKALLILVALAGTADAGNHCHELSTVMGRQVCRHFGSAWAMPSLRWELGPALAHGDGITGIGPRSRMAIGFRGFYLGDEFGAAFSTNGAASDETARGALPDRRGTIVTAMLLVGKQANVGRAFVGAEVALGMHAFVAGPGDPGSVRFEIEPRVRAGLWLSHWVSASAIAGASVLNRGDYSIGLVIGLHLFPYDGTR